MCERMHQPTFGFPFAIIHLPSYHPPTPISSVILQKLKNYLKTSSVQITGGLYCRTDMHAWLHIFKTLGILYHKRITCSTINISNPDAIKLALSFPKSGYRISYVLNDAIL